MSLTYICVAFIGVVLNNVFVEYVSLRIRITVGYVLSFGMLLLVAVCDVSLGLFPPAQSYRVTLVAVATVAVGCTGELFVRSWRCSGLSCRGGVGDSTPNSSSKPLTYVTGKMLEIRKLKYLMSCHLFRGRHINNIRFRLAFVYFDICKMFNPQLLLRTKIHQRRELTLEDCKKEVGRREE